jgi:endogenous inhibitor of DNA gyrase (YacG/DUF329 family)
VCGGSGLRKPRIARTCPHCGGHFFPPSPSHPKIFCSKRCSVRARFKCEAA